MGFDNILMTLAQTPQNAQVDDYLKKQKTSPSDVFLLTVNDAGEWKMQTKEAHDKIK